MLNLNSKLKELEEKGGKINIGLVGTGQMGRGIVDRVLRM